MRFELEERDRLLAVLQFLRPITAAATIKEECKSDYPHALQACGKP
jgi:hypothetical protein